MSETGIWAKADAAAFAMLMGENRNGRRLQAAERTMAGARERIAKLRRQLSMMTAKANEMATKAIEREFNNSRSAWGRTFRVRIKPGSIKMPTKPKPSASAQPAKQRRARRAYKAPIIDRRGRTAIYFRIRYIGLKSKKWRAGLTADHALYILREDALQDGELGIISNMGENAAEIANCWRALEAVETGYRANAIMQYRIVMNLPAELTPAQRHHAVQHFAERTFGKSGLPYVAAVHKPDEGGDSRNFHAHICFSTRPCERIDTGEWLISEEKVNGLTDPAGLFRMRAQAAAHLNLACHHAGIAARYTHQSYRDRGINAVRQEHVGPHAMAAFERGEPVAVIERNEAIVVANELGIETDKRQAEVDLLARLTACLQQQYQLVARKAAIQKMRHRVEAVAQRAAAIGSSKTKAAVIDRLQVETILARSTWLLAQKKARHATLPSAIAGSIAVRAQALAQQLASVNEQRRFLNNVKIYLKGIQRSFAHHQARVEQQRLAEAGALVATVMPRPYRMENRQLVPDLSGMTAAQQALIRSVDRQAMSIAFRRRHEEDCLADEAKAIAAAAERQRQFKLEAERLAAEQAREQRLIEEACRILDKAASRPYRFSRGTLTADLSSLDEVEQSTVIDAGIFSDEIMQTLRERAARDKAADDLKTKQALVAKVDTAATQEVMQSPPPPPPPPPPPQPQPQPQPLFQPGFVVGALNKIVEAGSFIFSRDGQFSLEPKAAADMGLDDQFFKDADVQKWLKLEFEMQQVDVSLFMAHLEERPDHFQYTPGQSGFFPDAPAHVHQAFSRRNTPEFQGILASYIEGNAELKARLEAANRQRQQHAGQRLVPPGAQKAPLADTNAAKPGMAPDSRAGLAADQAKQTSEPSAPQGGDEPNVNLRQFMVDRGGFSR